MKGLLQAVIVLAICFAIAPFALADEHRRDRDHDREHHYAYAHDKHHDGGHDRREHHDRGHHYAYDHYKHHHPDHHWDRDHDRRADWRTHHADRRPATTQVVNNKAPVKIAGPNAGTPVTPRTAQPQSQSGVFGAQR